jgi:hypothetical protein
MKTFISALLLMGFSVFTVQAQQAKQVVQKIIDVAPDGTKNTMEIYATGTSNKVVTKVNPPKGSDVVHEEQTYDTKTKGFITTKQTLANGKVINAASAKTSK